MDIKSIDILSPQRQSLFSNVLLLVVPLIFLSNRGMQLFLDFSKILDIICLLPVMTDENLTPSSPNHQPFPSFLCNYTIIFIKTNK